MRDRALIAIATSSLFGILAMAWLNMLHKRIDGIENRMQNINKILDDIIKALENICDKE